MEGVIVVARAVWLRLCAEAGLHVPDDGRRCPIAILSVAFHGRQIDEWLERRAWLARRERDIHLTVNLSVIEVRRLPTMAKIAPSLGRTARERAVAHVLSGKACDLAFDGRFSRVLNARTSMVV